MLEDRWTTRDFPVLREVARRVDETMQYVSVADVMQATGLPEADVIRAGVALAGAGLVDTMGAMGHPVVRFTGISPEARRKVGLWPDAGDATDRLIWALEQKIEQTTDAEQRGRLAKLRDAVAGVGRDLMVEVTAAMLTRGI